MSGSTQSTSPTYGSGREKGHLTSEHDASRRRAKVEELSKDSRLADEDRALLGSTATNIDDNGGRDGEEDDEETGEGSRVGRPSLCDDRETLREPDTGERERDRSLFSLCRDKDR
ncbi:hypothetical protein CIRG_07146 [Coccidioides immitis RMSCC 2394]|uniref:Uncharacterized protein n=1 Tax=Coccidioides immitis RMSCC 2394 TaxID=404692 RepID=A0A0J6YIL8_COCIT|nr:hypothetical protein CIRG_07146 [Coccidioides immitis RMSCC 2394]